MSMSLNVAALPTKASNTTKPGTTKKHTKDKALSPQFGAGLHTSTTGSVKLNKVTGLLDFTSVGSSPLSQLALLLISLVACRLWAANERRKASEHKRWNEIRENLTRDLPVFFFWFFGVPLLQRAYLYIACRKNPNLKNILIQKVATQAPENAGLGRRILHNLRALNPMSSLHIASSQQIKDQMAQTLKTLERAGIPAHEVPYKDAKANYEHLIKHRNLATALGLAFTTVLMGVGINLFNIYVTRKNVSTELADLAETPIQPPLTEAPSLPPSNNTPVSPFYGNAPGPIPMTSVAMPVPNPLAPTPLSSVPPFAHQV
jgi:hypothetical protein